MLKSTSSAAVLASAAILAACSTVGPDFKQPAAPTVAGYAMAGDTFPANAALSPRARAAGPWWQALGSPELDQLMQQALANSPEIAFAEANLRAANAEAAARTGDQSFKIDSSANAQRERINTQSFGFTGFPSPTINLYELGVSSSYDFDIFGKKRRASEAAAARAQAEARRADAAYLMLTANVASAAVRIATLRAEIESVEKTAKGDQIVIDMINRAQTAGGAPRSATSIGESQLAQDLVLIPPLERELAEERHRLALLLGKSPAEWAAPDFALENFRLPTDLPVTIPSELVRQRPDILAAEADLHAVTADIGVATANLYPSLGLTASLTQGSIEPSDLFRYGSSGWSIGAGVAAPIFQGGMLKAQKQKAVAQADAAMANYQRVVLKAFVQVSDALAGIESYNRSIVALDRARQAAQANVDDTSRAYELGAGSLLPIFDARRQLNLADRQKVQVQGDQLRSVIELFAATAADWRQTPAP
jgi:NodT family efflux transporter outer membrane factor (OMF) lipoprotein